MSETNVVTLPKTTLVRVEGGGKRGPEYRVFHDVNGNGRLDTRDNVYSIYAKPPQGSDSLGLCIANCGLSQATTIYVTSASRRDIKRYGRRFRKSVKKARTVRNWMKALPAIFRGTCYAYWGTFALKARDVTFSPALALSSRVHAKRFAVQAVPKGRVVDPKICRAAMGSVTIPHPREELGTLTVKLGTGGLVSPIWLEVIFGGRPMDLTNPLSAAHAAAAVTVDGARYAHLGL